MHDGFMIADDPYDIFLMHYGTPHQGSVPHSGRYKWGSGDSPYQRYCDLYTKRNYYKKQGLDDSQIAEKLGIFNRYGKPDVAELKRKYSNAKSEMRAYERAEALRLRDAGYNTSEIGRIMGKGESSIRSLYDEGKAIRNNLNRSTADILKKAVDRDKYIDISAGTEYALGVTKNRLDNAVSLLKDEGYNQHYIKIDQMGTGHKTTITVLTPPDVDYSELIDNKYDIKSLMTKSKMIDVRGEVEEIKSGPEPFEHPKAVDPSRVMIRYAEDGGKEKDGLIELRRGVDDISLGGKHLAQVRINVGDELYLKGTARYTDEKMPPGVDMIFNTNKTKDKSFEEVLKPLEKIKEDDPNSPIDWEIPFGATVTQRHYEDADGNRQLSALNIVREEGEWQTWDRNIPSQLGSKQTVKFADRRLKLAYADKRLEFEEICNLTNPTVKKKLLIDFGDQCDSAAVELKGAPVPGQQTYVISPFPELKCKAKGDAYNEIYAPNYADGTQVALIRYPHSGQHEIPICVVKNTGSPAAKILGTNTPDVVGINAGVAEILSGADFDGDTVSVLPLSSTVRISTKDPLPGLLGIDIHEKYAAYKGMKVIGDDQMQIEMGKITNLITDMSFQHPTTDELTRAVIHSMVIIDSKKHKLDWKRSEYENRIIELKEKYQKNDKGGVGAGTIISRASSPMDIPSRKEWYPSTKSIDPETGAKKYDPIKDPTYMKGILKGRTKKDGGEVIVNEDKKNGGLYYLKPDPDTGKKVRVYVTEDDFKNGLKTVTRTMSIDKMAYYDDAYKLTSAGSKDRPMYPMERVYAEYANNMKALGNLARKEWLKTENLEYSKDAHQQYKEQVDSLERKLALAKMNSPLERQAQLLAGRRVTARKASNPGMTNEEIQKLQGREIIVARAAVGANKYQIKINDDEWKAIQSGAISHSKLSEILDYCDMKELRQKATPRVRKEITPAMKAMAKRMAADGVFNDKIADRLGISASSVSAILNGK